MTPEELLASFDFLGDGPRQPFAQTLPRSSGGVFSPAPPLALPVSAPQPGSLLAAMDDFHPTRQSAAGRAARSAGIVEGAEFLRIFNLPRRKLEEIPDYCQQIYHAYKTPYGTMVPYFIQGAAIAETYDYRGSFIMIPVGGGKTLVSLLLPTVLQAQRPVLIVPANLKRKAITFDIPFHRQHFRLHPNIVVLTYSEIQHPKHVELLARLKPDLVICDEAQNFRHQKTRRSKIFFDYLDDERPIFVPMSGGFTRGSVKDYAHIIYRAIPRLCPVPISYKAVQEWADAIDAHVPEEKRVGPGALAKFCLPGEDVRAGFRRRLIETPAVIAAANSGFAPGEEEPSLEVFEVDPGEPPKEIATAFEQLRSTWTAPGGEEIADAMVLYRHASQLALGFYTRWVWPGGVVDIEWVRARKDWYKFVRETLRYNRRGYYSIFDVFNACERGEYAPCEPYEKWLLVADRYGEGGKPPPTEPVWVSDWLIRDVAKRMSTVKEPTLVWVRSPHLGEALAKALNVPYFGRGSQGDGILTYAQTCVLSSKVHGTGKNLQDRFANNVWAEIPQGNDNFEQNLGRTFRSGQKSDTVRNYVYLHCREIRRSFEKSLREAAYVVGTTGQPQRLAKATCVMMRTLTDVNDLEQSGKPLWMPNKGAQLPEREAGEKRGGGGSVDLTDLVGGKR